MATKQDTRTFTFAGTCADPSGTIKARFTTSVSRTERLTKQGFTDINLVELPERMTKLAAIAYLLETKPDGVDLDVLGVKEVAITEQNARANGESTGRKRGRPTKEKTDAELEAEKAIAAEKIAKKLLRETQREEKAREVAERKAMREADRLTKVAEREATQAAKTKTPKNETIVTTVVKAAKASKAKKTAATE